MVSILVIVIKGTLNFQCAFLWNKGGKILHLQSQFQRGGFIHFFFDKLEKCNIK